MRLYVTPFAPNALRAQIVAAEKGVELELADAAADKEAYRAVNPLGQVPALVTDDGRVITESLTVCQFLDAQSGVPHLFGDSPDERVEIAMWERRAEASIFNPAVEYGHQVHPMFAAIIPQFPDYAAATLKPGIRRAVAVFANRLGQTPYVAGDRFTAADVTAFLGVVLATGYGIVGADEHPPLRVWFETVLARESMAPIRMMMTVFTPLTTG